MFFDPAIRRDLLLSKPAWCQAGFLSALEDGRTATNTICPLFSMVSAIPSVMWGAVGGVRACLEPVLNLACETPGADEMRSGEGGEEVIESIHVGQIHYVQPESETLLLMAEETVLTNG